MGRALISRLPFLLAAALIAAGLADPVVESIANTGLLGGNYADNNHTSIIPTLLAALVLVVSLLALRCLAVWRIALAAPYASLITVARDFANRPCRHDVPLVVALQLGALFLMENIEQLRIDGTLVAGAAWLGGPIIFSLVTHALFGVGCTFALSAIMRLFVRGFAALVRTAIAFIWVVITRSTTAATTNRRRNARCWRAQPAYARQIGGRAPPALLQTQPAFSTR